MADLFNDGSNYGLYLADPDPPVQLVNAHVWSMEEEDSAPSSRFGMTDESFLLSTTVPEPIRLRGVGATTL